LWKRDKGAMPTTTRRPLLLGGQNGQLRAQLLHDLLGERYRPQVGAVGKVTDRPSHALNLQIREQLDRQVAGVGRDPIVVVVTGSGSPPERPDVGIHVKGFDNAQTWCRGTDFAAVASY
jgi:hypothetical protein